jgi:hypothetical protein
MVLEIGIKSRTTIPFRNKKFTITDKLSGFYASLGHKSNISCGITEPSAHKTFVNCMKIEFKKVPAEKFFKLNDLLDSSR